MFSLRASEKGVIQLQPEKVRAPLTEMERCAEASDTHTRAQHSCRGDIWLPASGNGVSPKIFFNCKMILGRIRVEEIHRTLLESLQENKADSSWRGGIVRDQEAQE